MTTVPARPEGAILQFLGATGTVTGSRFLVDGPRARVLVDCGLYQGPKELRERNWRPLPVEADSLDAVVLTHAHVDHSGYLPRLAREGFRGRVFATRGSAELCRIVLPDAAYLQEEEASYANRKGYSKHDPALPLFTHEDAEEILARFEPTVFQERVDVADGVRATFRRAGHILGAASVLLEVGEQRIVVSGDLGRPEHPILLPPEPPPETDALLVESTYGDRSHAAVDPVERLAEAVVRVAERGGVIVIPAFAVDRTEIVLLHLKRLMHEGRIPALPIHADSPMALAALAVYRRAIADGWPEIRPELRGAGEPFDSGTLVEARDVEASKAIHQVRGPAIVVSASGMATGGRVLHHLAARLPDPRNAVFLVGFQAAATRGRQLLDGAPMVKLLGRYVPVRAEIVDLSHFSVHADRPELLAWLGSAKAPPGLVFVVHGEPEASNSLRQGLADELGWDAVIPRYRERVRVGVGSS